MKKLNFEIAGKTQSGFAQLIDDKVWLHFGGRTFAVSSQPSARKGSRKLSPKSGNIVSPMPGKITKILVKVGDAVAENQSIIVIEAMKMEYALKSQVVGVVKDLCFNVDAQVPLGATLAVIEVPKAT